MHDTSTADSNGETWSSYCHTCYRFKEAGDTGFLNLGDDRQLCSDCSSIAISRGDREGCSFIIQKVYDFFKSSNLQVNEDIPIVFVDNNQMRRLCEDSRSAVGLFSPSVSTCIQCLSAFNLPLPVRLWYTLTCCIIPKLMTIPAAIRTTEAYTRSGVNIAKSMKFFFGDMIFVLFGKPDVEMGGLLAHEIMHGWFLSQGYNPWEHERSVDEGICQVMYHKWLDWFCSKGFNSSRKTKEQVQYARKLKEKLALGLNEWYDDEVYGQGFRNAMRAIKTSGFEATLDHTLKEGALPPVETTTMRKKTTSAAITDQLLCKEGTLPPGVTTTMRKKTASAAITELLWKAAGSKTESLWKATTVTITNLLLKATGAICETPRFVAMEGQRHHHYHHGQSHNNLHASNSMSASPTLLVMFFGILIEHK